MVKAEGSGDLRTALSAVRELVRIVELLARIRGEIRGDQTVNIWLLPEWQRLESTSLDVLNPHPEIRQELSSRLKVHAGWVDRTGMGHTVVGRLVLGHTARWEGFGWGRQVNLRTASVTRQPVYWVRPHPDLMLLLAGV